MWIYTVILQCLQILCITKTNRQGEVFQPFLKGLQSNDDKDFSYVQSSPGATKIQLLE